MWLGVKKNPATGGDQVVLIDPATNEEIGDYTAINQARAAEASARMPKPEARAAETQCDGCRSPGPRRRAARIRQLEAELKRLKGRRSRKPASRFARTGIPRSNRNPVELFATRSLGAAPRPFRAGEQVLVNQLRQDLGMGDVGLVADGRHDDGLGLR